MVKKKELIKDLIGWKLGNGDKIYFWRDLWLPNKRLKDYTREEIHVFTPVAEFINNGNWNLDKLRDHLPGKIVLEIQGSPLGERNGEYNIIWPHTSNGKFSSKSAYNMIRMLEGEYPNWPWQKIWKTKLSLELNFSCG